MKNKLGPDDEKAGNKKFITQLARKWYLSLDVELVSQILL